jgi:hypothetical protein
MWKMEKANGWGVGGVDCHLLNIEGHIQKGVQLWGRIKLVFFFLGFFFSIFKIEISSKTRYLVT